MARGAAAPGTAQAQGGSSEPWIWEEVGSKNQAGHTRCAAVGALRGGERALYVGSALGGLWRGTRDGNEWTPLSDGIYGGIDDMAVLEPLNLASPDILVVRRGSEVLRSDDGGETWVEPNGLGALRTGRRMVRTGGSSPVIYRFGTASVPGAGVRSALFASIDEGRSFAMRSSFGTEWPGDVWVPRTAALSGSGV